jgi:hypothetical protein
MASTRFRDARIKMIKKYNKTFYVAQIKRRLLYLKYWQSFHVNPYQGNIYYSQYPTFLDDARRELKYYSDLTGEELLMKNEVVET